MPSFTDWLTIAELLSGMAGGRNDSQSRNEALGLSSVGGQNADQLNRDKFALEAPGERLRQGVQASYVKNYQPVTAGSGIDPASGRKVVHWNGGTNNPDAIDPEARQLASEVEHQHLLDQMSGGDKKPIIPRPAIGGSDVTSKLLAGGQAASTGAGILSLLGLLPFGGGGKSGGVGDGNTPITQGQWDADGNWVPAPSGFSLFPAQANPNQE